MEKDPSFHYGVPGQRMNSIVVCGISRHLVFHCFAIADMENLSFHYEVLGPSMDGSSIRRRIVQPFLLRPPRMDSKCNAYKARYYYL